jgi:hypothetical protein
LTKHAVACATGFWGAGEWGWHRAICASSAAVSPSQGAHGVVKWYGFVAGSTSVAVHMAFSLLKSFKFSSKNIRNVF